MNRIWSYFKRETKQEDPEFDWYAETIKAENIEDLSIRQQTLAEIEERKINENNVRFHKDQVEELISREDKLPKNQNEISQNIKKNN